MSDQHPYVGRMLRSKWTPEVWQWFRDNVDPKSWYLLKDTKYVEDGMIEYKFANEADAVLFQLRFG